MLYRIWPLLKEVYHYEKHSTLDSDYLRQVLTLAVVVLFALNFSCNGLDKPVVFVLTGLTSLVLLMVEWLLPRAKNEKHLVMFSNTALIFMGLLLLVWNENDGFQNLWFFLMPATLFVQSGLPIGLPFCTAYGLAATCFLWAGSPRRQHTLPPGLCAFLPRSLLVVLSADDNSGHLLQTLPHPAGAERKRDGT